jgi:hypothetical protein
MSRRCHGTNWFEKTIGLTRYAISGSTVTDFTKPSHLVGAPPGSHKSDDCPSLLATGCCPQRPWAAAGSCRPNTANCY